MLTQIAENIDELHALRISHLNNKSKSAGPLARRTLVIVTSSLNRAVETRTVSIRKRQYGRQLYRSQGSTTRSQQQCIGSASCKVHVLQYVYDLFSIEFGSCEEKDSLEMDSAPAVAAEAATLLEATEVIEVLSGSEIGSEVIDLCSD